MELNYDFRNLTQEDIERWNSASHETKFGLCYRINDNEELKHDKVALMNIVSIRGVEPWILDYVGEDVRNDMEFLSVLIHSTDETRFSFIEFFNDDGSFKYSNAISPKVRSNPMFWDVLNAHSFELSKKFPFINNYRFDKAKEIAKAQVELDELMRKENGMTL